MEYTLQQIASQVRRDIVRMVTAAASGHPGGSMSATDVLTYLYFKEMNVTPETWTRNGEGIDQFFLSAGHISPVLYSVLARRGYFPVAELATFRRFGTRLQGHPSIEKGLPGVNQAAGSLGQGLSVAIGAALAKRLNRILYAPRGEGRTIREYFLVLANFYDWGLLSYLEKTYQLTRGDLVLCGMITVGLEPACISKILHYDHERTFYNKRSDIRQKLHLDHTIPLENFLSEQAEMLQKDREAYLRRIKDRY